MSEHTPGPWIAHSGSISGAGAVYQVNGAEIAELNAQQPEVEANAKLIAVAPEMLLILALLCRDPDGPGDHWDKANEIISELGYPYTDQGGRNES